MVLSSGSAIPADCRVNEGRIEVDQSALTGESLPVSMVGPVGQPKMGSTVTRGEVEATVEARARPPAAALLSQCFPGSPARRPSSQRCCGFH